jgi:hypothetical protein
MVAAWIKAQHMIGIGHVLLNAGKNRGEIGGAEHEENHRNAKREGKVTHAIDDHRLDGGAARARPIVPIANQ